MRDFFLIMFLFCGCLTTSAQSDQSQTVQYPKVIEAVAPDYPEKAISKALGGRVVVVVDVGPKGVVDSVRTLEGPAIFERSVLQAAKRWRFVESEERQKRVAELAFVFLMSNERGSGSAVFLPPNQIEVIGNGSGRPSESVAKNRIGEDDEHPEVIKFVAPFYPAIAMQAKASGEVKVEVRMDDKGEVIFASAKSGHPLLLAGSLMAARKWEFVSSASKKERSVMLTFVYHAKDLANGAGPFFISPYQVEVVFRPANIDFTTMKRSRLSVVRVEQRNAQTLR
jgi:TonB family protein